MTFRKDPRPCRGLHRELPFVRWFDSCCNPRQGLDRKSTRLNSSHQIISYAVFCLKKKTSELQSPDHLVCRLLLEKKHDTTHVTRSIRRRPRSQHNTSPRLGPMHDNVHTHDYARD